jgi:uncharacterized protein
VGHMGEGLPAMLARCDQLFARVNQRRRLRGVADTLRSQLWITTSGFHDRASFIAAREAFGLQRLLFSADYPYNSGHAGEFFEMAQLSDQEQLQVASGNATALLRIPA